MIGWLRDLDPASYLLDEVRPGESIVITVDALAAIDEYAFSSPTAPSAGRVYRRTDFATGITYVFIVEDAPADDPLGGQLHYPLQALVVS